MHGVDLKIAPIERAVRVVVVDLALPLWILRPLDRKSNAAVGAELSTRVLLPRGQSAPAWALGLRALCPSRCDSFRNYQRPLESNRDGALKADRVLAVKPPEEAGCDR